MKISKTWALCLLALAAAACHPAGTDLQPIVIDLSAAKTPAPAATPTPVPTATRAPAATPAPERPAAAPTPPPTVRAGEPSASTRPVSTPRAPEEVAQSRIDAHNRRELDALVVLYAPDARIYEPPDRLRDSGIEQIRQTYSRRFASAPGAKITVAQRMTQGNFVVDRETETGDPWPPASALVISEIREGKIVRVWILR